MKLYVWDNPVFNCGLYVALASSEEEARELLADKLYPLDPCMLVFSPAVYELDTPVAFEHGCCLT